MKKIKLNSGKLNLYKEKVSSLSDAEKGSIIGGGDTSSNCPTTSTNQPTTTDGDTGSRNPPCWSHDGNDPECNTTRTQACDSVSIG